MSLLKLYGWFLISLAISLPIALLIGNIDATPKIGIAVSYLMVTIITSIPEIKSGLKATKEN